MYRRKSKTRYVPQKDAQDYGNSNYSLEQQEYELQKQGNEIEAEPARESTPSYQSSGQSGSAQRKPLQKPGRRKENNISYYAYGKSAAIEFVCDETKKHRIATIAIQAASAKEHERGYAWDDKTVIQVPRNELLQIVAIMLGKQERAEFRHATQYTSKSYVVEHQGGKIFFMVSEKGKPIRAVGLSPDDTYQVVTLFLRQLKTNAPWLSVEEIILLIERTVVQMRENVAHLPDDADDDGDYGDDDFDASDSAEEEQDDRPIELFSDDEDLLNDPPNYIELKY